MNEMFNQNLPTMKKNLLFKKLNGKKAKALMVFIFAVFVAPVAFSQYGDNIIPNGTFDNGVSGWSLKLLKKSKATLSGTADAHSGDSAALFDVTVLPESGGISKTMMYVDPPVLSSDTNAYKITFWAKSSLDGSEVNVQVQAKDANGNSKYNATTFTLTTDYQKYVWIYNPHRGFNNFILKFRCGGAIAQYYFDDVTMQPISGLPNLDFEEGLNVAWQLDTITAYGAAAVLSEETTSPHGGTIAAKVEVTATDDTLSHIVLKNNAKYFGSAGNAFKTSFFAKGTDGADSIYIAWNCFAGGTYVYTVLDSFALTQEWAQYTTFSQFADSITSISLRFQMGRKTGVYYVDDIEFRESPTGISEIMVGEKPLFYPNPARDIIYLKTEPGALVRILDVTGKVLIQEKVIRNNQSININHLTKGLYLIQFKQEEKTVVQKMVVR